MDWNFGICGSFYNFDNLPDSCPFEHGKAFDNLDNFVSCFIKMIRLDKFYNENQDTK